MSAWSLSNCAEASLNHSYLRSISAGPNSVLAKRAACPNQPNACPTTPSPSPTAIRITIQKETSRSADPGPAATRFSVSSQSIIHLQCEVPFFNEGHLRVTALPAYVRWSFYPPHWPPHAHARVI